MHPRNHLPCLCDLTDVDLESRILPLINCPWYLVTNDTMQGVLVLKKSSVGITIVSRIPEILRYLFIYYGSTSCHCQVNST